MRASSLRPSARALLAVLVFLGTISRGQGSGRSLKGPSPVLTFLRGDLKGADSFDHGFAPLGLHRTATLTRGGAVDAKRQRGAGKSSSLVASKLSPKAVSAITSCLALSFLAALIATQRIDLRLRFNPTVIFTSLSSWLNTVVSPLVLALRSHKLGPLYFYILFSIYTSLGLTTTPVETACGYAFGFKLSSMLCMVAKSTGSMMAYMFFRTTSSGRGDRGRSTSTSTSTSASSSIEAKLSSFASRSPLLAAVIVRMSVLPELAKNYALSRLPLSPLNVYLAILLHGSPYSVLWSFVGSKVEEGNVKNEIKAFIVGAGVAGVVLPLLVVAKVLKDC